MALKEKLDALFDLYAKTGEDWVLSVSLILTEPVCPIACIAPEGSDTTKYAFVADTIEEAIELAADAVHREVILGLPREQK